jgi:hypothetical protein
MVTPLRSCCYLVTLRVRTSGRLRNWQSAETLLEASDGHIEKAWVNLAGQSSKVGRLDGFMELGEHPVAQQIKTWKPGLWPREFRALTNIQYRYEIRA